MTEFRRVLFRSELHASRAEYGEILLHEFIRTGDTNLWLWTAAFAERFQQVSINRGRHHERGGAVRGRYGDHESANRIRSMRGAAYLWQMADLTGREDYRRSALGIADYLTRSFPWTNGRQGAAVRDLVFMHRVTGDARYRDTAQQIVTALQAAQQPGGGWFEYWDANLNASVYDPPGHHGGQWTPAATIKPEMASYNVNGLLDALSEPSPLGRGGQAADMVRRAAEWLLGVQSREGAWPFPDPTSKGLYGYGIGLDAAAMLKAGRYFRDTRYFDAGVRAVEFALRRLERHGIIPALLNVADADQTEGSMTYFYLLEALAVMDLGPT